MTHLLDTSGMLALLFDERGADRVSEIIDDPTAIVGISALTLFEVMTAAFRRMGSYPSAIQVVAECVASIERIVPVTEEIVRLAMDLRQEGAARIATVDIVIAATAALHGAILVHRDPHFASLPSGRPVQESLPAKI